LPAEQAATLLAYFESVVFRPGDVLYAPGVHPPFASFPTGCFVSLQYVSRSGAPVEIAAVGTDGLVGVPSLLGSPPTHHAVVEVGGPAIRIPLEVLNERVGSLPALRSVFDAYTHALLTQVAQTAACNTVHTLSQRFSRWLLVCRNRLDTSEIPATQEQLARLLGVRRESINHVATELRNAEVLRNGRGHVQIVDRAGLESVACECHDVIEGAYAWLSAASRRGASAFPAAT
jgi:CRP-like cAMP-binding protein